MHDMDRYAVIEGVFRNLGCVQGKPDLLDCAVRESKRFYFFQSGGMVRKSYVFERRAAGERITSDFSDGFGENDVR